MNSKSPTDALNKAIHLLQNRQAEELVLLKEQFHITCESLKPINLLKSTFREATSSAEINGNLVNNAIGLTTGYLSRKVLLGSSHNPVKNILGMLLQFFVGNVVSKHVDTIKSTGGIILRSFFKNNNEGNHQFTDNGNGKLNK